MANKIENIKLSNIAVLIDADNTSAGVIDDVFANIAELGNIGTKRIYGDWSQNHLKSWQDAILKHAMTPIQQFAYTKGKNATDINMVIDAMDLLIDGNYDGFCLVSSDSDFAPLASKVRAKGYKVFGFGKKNTPQSFKKSCDQFICIDETSANKSITTQKNETSQSAEKAKAIPKDIKTLVLNAIEKNADESGWLKMELLASQINKQDASFSVKKYGFARFYTFLNSISEVEIKKQGNSYICRNKNSNKQTVSPPPEKKALTQKEKNLIIGIITDNLEEDGWAKIGLIGKELKNRAFNYKDYGFAKLSNMLKSIPELEIKFENNIYFYRTKLSDKNKVPSSLSQQEKPVSANSEPVKSLPKYNKSQINHFVLTILKNSTHKKNWTALPHIENQLRKLDSNFNPQNYDCETLEDLLDSFNLQRLEISLNGRLEKYYRKVPFLKLLDQLEKVMQRSDIDLRESDGKIKACALGHYAHFHVHYGKYGFNSFFSFFEEVMAYYEKKEKGNAS